MILLHAFLLSRVPAPQQILAREPDHLQGASVLGDKQREDDGQFSAQRSSVSFSYV